jgi:ribosomal protein S12 methylthiotransferase
MVERGVKEINLIAQDTTMYGWDLRQDQGLEDLLENLLKIHGIGWVRVLYCHPHRISDRLLALLDEENVICPYLDVPLQHVNEKVLKAMGRDTERESPWQLIDRIRSRTRRLSLRTTLMVGFPGETADVFEELYQFVKGAAIDHLGVFTYSREKGTPAARLKDVVEQEVAEKRREAVMSLQADISRVKNQRMVGKTVEVLHEGFSLETELLSQGRTKTMAPEVDGRVLINKGEGRLGDFVQVRIKEAHEYDLIGEVV